MKKHCKCGKEIWGYSSQCSKCLGLIQRGAENPRWKGGSYTKGGYIMTYVGTGQYVFEHILVMEKHIGRKLLKGETVHHLNGIKNDNQIKNLELWVRPQPSGIRAKDALSWAEQITKNYKSIQDKL